MKQTEYFGFGSIRRLEDIIKKEQPKFIFLVTGKSSFESCGAKRELDEIIHVPYARFNDFSPNPKIREIQKGYRLFNDISRHDMILAVGGGSAIDVAKAIKLFYFNETGIKVPLVAIPTTAGSGSEATYFIVYYAGKKKQSEGKQEITLPNYAIIDPNFIMNLPKKISADTGMDALGQAIESYWSIHPTNKSKVFAKKAIKLLLTNLEKSVNNPDKASKEAVMKAANLAGKAINISKTTACHAIAYPMTSYFNIPHGHAVGLTLGEMLVYNSGINAEECNDSRGVEYVKKTIDELIRILHVNDADEANSRIKELMNSIGLKTRLSELGLKEKDKKTIIKNGFNPERVKNNPRLLTEENLRKILDKIY